MPQVYPKAVMLTHTPDPLTLIYTAYKQCYSKKNVILVYNDESILKQDKVNLVKKCMESGHLSPLEHVSFTFAVSGISRAASHQLVRHRVASYCVAYDTQIATSSQRTNRKTISELYNLTKQYKDLVKVRCVDETTGVLGYGDMGDIVYSGKQMCYEIVTDFGYKIKTTKYHRFLTKTGWKQLNELSVGDVVYVNGIACYKDKQWLNEQYNILNKSQESIGEFCGVTKHTIRSWIRKLRLQKPLGLWSVGKSPINKGKTKYDYEPLMRASMKNIGRSVKPKFGSTNPAWKGDNITKSGGYSRANRWFAKTNICENCNYIGKTELHHKDGNPFNNRTDNVCELCVSCHKAIHKREIREKIIPNKIVSITPVGVMDTYDICMSDPHHNFIANGFVVHNSQQSQRYIKPSTDFDYVVPPSIDKHPELKDEYVKQIHSHVAAYEKLTSEENHITKEDARFLFPNAIATSLVVTMNARSLLNFFELRCCNRAQWEIRDIANQMLTHCQFVLPEVFVGAGPKCIRQGYCSEGAEFTCGKYPTKEEYFSK